MTTYNTGNAVPSADAKDRFDNSQTFDEVVNSPLETAANRIGQQVLTFAGMATRFSLAQDQRSVTFQVFLDGIGFSSLGPYGAGISITSHSQVVEYLGQPYSLKSTVPASVTAPYVTTGNWATEGANFKLVGDSTIRQELAAPTGAGLSGFDQSLTYSTGTVGAALKSAVVGPLAAYRPSGDPSGPTLATRYATLAEAQAFYPHATSLTQTIDWAAIQGYLNSGKGVLSIPDGTFVIGNDDLVQNGGAVQLNFSPRSVLKFGANKRLIVQGALVALPALSVDATANARQITLASAPSLVPGDVICLYDRRDFSWSVLRNYYRQGEFLTVAKVTGNVVSVYGTLRYTYAVANIDVYKITGGSVVINDLTVDADPATVGASVIIRLCKGAFCNRVSSNSGIAYAVEFDRCMGGKFSYGQAKNALTGFDDYGVIVSNSTNIRVEGDLYAGRHALALGGGDSACAIPYRGTRVFHCKLYNLDGGVGAADTHGNGDDTVYFDCEMFSHANMAGKDVTFDSCRIYSRTGTADGSVIYGSEVVGGEFRVIDCQLIVNGDLATYGAISIQPRELLRFPLTVTVRGGSASGNVTGALGKLLQVSAKTGETLKTNVNLEGMDCSGLNQLLAFVWVRCEETPANPVVSDGIVSNPLRGPAGAYLLFPTPGIAGIKTRQMRQSGSVVVTTAVGATPTELIAAPQSFPFRYSKVPDVITTCGNIDGVSSNLVGSRISVPGYFSVTDAAVRPCATATSGNFTTGAQAKLSWIVGIADI